MFVGSFVEKNSHLRHKEMNGGKVDTGYKKHQKDNANWAMVFFLRMSKDIPIASLKKARGEARGKKAHRCTIGFAFTIVK